MPLKGMALIMKQNPLHLFSKGKKSPIMPLGESLEIMQQMDQIRKEWPLTYPMDTGDSTLRSRTKSRIVF